MAQNKEDLDALLKFIDGLIHEPGNEDFVAGLKALVYDTDNPNVKAELEDIRRILNIRGQQSVDYSFVNDKVTRDQLIIDNLRMENAYLNRDLSIEDRWNEYCSYIHFQVENILNYYYEKAFVAFDLAQRYIEKFTAKCSEPFIRDEKNTKACQISTYYKTFAFCDDFFPFSKSKPDYTSSRLSKIRKVRNEYIHRLEPVTVRDLQKNSNLGQLKISLIKLVDCIKSQIESNLFVEAVPAVVASKLPECATIRYNEDQVTRLGEDVFTKYSQKLEEGKQIQAIFRGNVLLDIIVE